VVFGTRGSQGYVMVFDTATLTFQSYKLPTAVFANMKDGITVGPSGEVWLTESSANKIARLLIR
jgi:streptogramin lyase